MTIPDAAIEAAMPAFRQAFRQAFWANDAPTDQTLVSDVIEAAMPAIREALAQEIEAAGRADVEWLAANRKDKLDMGRLIGAEDAWKDALRIVQGDTP